LDHLVKALAAKGHHIKKSALAEVLHTQGFSLRVNKKSTLGKSHVDRDAQFAHITGKCQQFEQKGAPIISVDCKKKELIGNFKNHGREWQAKGEQTCVNVSDFLSLADGKALPYGIYDLVHKNGFVNVGIDHHTAEFAVESIRRWWQHSGKALYPDQKELLITADGGGSKGVKNRLVARKSSSGLPTRQLARRRGDFGFDAPYVPLLIGLVGVIMLSPGLLSLLLFKLTILGVICLVYAAFSSSAHCALCTLRAGANSGRGPTSSPNSGCVVMSSFSTWVVDVAPYCSWLLLTFQVAKPLGLICGSPATNRETFARSRRAQC
jgi:hypothetical protein